MHNWTGKPQIYATMVVMWPVVKFLATDNLQLNGILSEGETKSDTALVYIHGLTSNAFSQSVLLGKLRERSKKLTILSINTRGAGLINPYKKINPNSTEEKERLTIGAGFEIFTDCVFDIEGALRFLEPRDYSQIILMGNSTGCNKAVYYAHKANDERVKAIVLQSPVRDIPAMKLWYQDKFADRKNTVKRLRKQKKGEKLVPQVMDGEYYCADRLYSLMYPGTKEDVFPYGEPFGSWKAFENVTIPMQVLLGEKDEYVQVPIQQIADEYKKHQKSNTHFRIDIYDQANHGFEGVEEKAAEHIFRFLVKMRLL